MLWEQMSFLQLHSQIVSKIHPRIQTDTFTLESLVAVNSHYGEAIKSSVWTRHRVNIKRFKPTIPDLAKYKYGYF